MTEKTYDLHGVVKGCQLGMDMAVSMARQGTLRLSPMSFERDHFRYRTKIRPVRATILIWTSWWREKRGKFYA